MSLENLVCICGPSLFQPNILLRPQKFTFLWLILVNNIVHFIILCLVHISIMFVKFLNCKCFASPNFYSPVIYNTLGAKTSY